MSKSMLSACLVALSLYGAAALAAAPGGSPATPATAATSAMPATPAKAAAKTEKQCNKEASAKHLKGDARKTFVKECMHSG